MSGHPIPQRSRRTRPSGPAARDPRDVGTLLGVWAHPDDEAYLSAGLMASVRRAGHHVTVLTATRGEQGTDDPRRWPPERLGPLRDHELAASLASLGVREHHGLGLPDGGCADVPLEEGVALVRRIVDWVRPDTIVTFGPDGMTGHPDHRAVSAWATGVWERTGRRARLWYATVTPAFHERFRSLNDEIGLWMDGVPAPATEPDELAFGIRLDDELLDRKLVALRAHASQTTALAARLGEATFRCWWAEESFGDASAVLAAGARAA